MNSYATGKAIGNRNEIPIPTYYQSTVNQTTTTRIIIIGNETGGRTEIDVTVNPKVVSNG